jgi:hypothetical protein
MSGWTEEKRQAERNRINQTKPWLKSTGAKTQEGKAICSQNAFKGGLHERINRLRVQVNAMLKEQKEALNRIQ